MNFKYDVAELILQVNKINGNVLVEYVDYGNIEWVEPSWLRKQIALRDVPVQCYKFPVRSDCVSVRTNSSFFESTENFIVFRYLTT